MFLWSERTGVTLRFIQPDKPIQNAFVESFNGRFREGCLNENWFASLAEAYTVIGAWRRHDNEERPHSALNYLPTTKFARRAVTLRSPPAPAGRQPVATQEAM